ATPTGQRYDSGEYDRALTKALEIAGVDKLRNEQQARVSRGDRMLLGIGMACYVEMCGFGPFESAVVRAEPSGVVTAYTGTSAHGQGHETTFAQIIADHLGVDFDRIVVRHGDTLNTPMGNGTGGSRSLAVGGSAIMQAALRVQAKARRIAAHMLEAAPPDVVFADGRYQVKGTPAKALAFAEIAARAYQDGLPPDVESGLEATEFFRPPQLVYPFGAHVAVVELDTETGRVAVRTFVSVDDCGVRISPMLVAGQVHGGLAQGIAQALYEALVCVEDLGGDPAEARLRQHALIGVARRFRERPLLGRGDVDSRAVLRADVVPLAHPLRRVVALPEHAEQSLVAHERRVEDDAHDLVVPRETRADLLVVRVRRVAGRVAGRRREDAALRPE